ncbi:MAG: RloB family protein [Brachymonas sp.]|jgi:hypothetical protein
MGTDNLFHKRKARAAKDLQRKAHKRTTNKRYLIVCEGTKTEPQYLRELQSDLSICSKILRIAPNNGTSPDLVVEHAKVLYKEEVASGDPFDRVYCVFDRDNHATFDAAVQHVSGLNSNGKPFFAITSTPCFEVWLLLHFDYSTQPFHPAGGKSVGDQVISRLKTKPGFERYGKGQKGIYTQLKDQLQKALDHAQRLRVDGAATGSTNPATNFDELVKEIQSLR